MSIHKLTAGDGYAYLTRQVAALDATEKGHTGLADYYSQRGESRACGSGRRWPASTWCAGQTVTAEQMASLFGRAGTPTLTSAGADLAGTGASARDQAARDRLGAPFPRPEVHPGLPDRGGPAHRRGQRRARRLPRDTLRGRGAGPDPHRGGPRMFAEAYGRAPADARELSGFIARSSRPGHDRGRRVRPDVLPGEVGVGAVGGRRRRRWPRADRARPTTPPSPTRWRWLEREAALHPAGKPGCGRSTSRAWSRRRSPTATPAPATRTCTPTSRSPTRSQTRRTGGGWRWTARVLYKANVAASERYNTRLEAELRRPARGARSPARRRPAADRGQAAGPRDRRRRPRRCRGLVLAAGSRSRSAGANWRPRSRPTTAGRPPRSRRSQLAQQATLETRDAKHEPRSFAEQRATWRAEAVAAARRHPEPRSTSSSTPSSRPPAPASRRQRPAAGPAQGHRAARRQHLTRRRRRAGRPGRSGTSAPRPNGRSPRRRRPRCSDVDQAVDQVVAAALHAEQSIR